MNGHIHNSEANPENGAASSRKADRNGPVSARECGHRADSREAGHNSAYVRVLDKDGEEGCQGAGGRRRFRVEADGKKLDIEGSTWNKHWKSGSAIGVTSDRTPVSHQEQEKTNAVGSGHRTQHSSRRKAQDGRAKGKERKKEIKKVSCKFKAELCERATEAEKHFKSILDHAGIRFKFQNVMKRSNTFSIVDFYLTQYSAVVEIDGGYHDTPEQAEKDRKRTRDLLNKNGVSVVIRFRNDEVFLGDKYVLRKLAKSLVPWAPQVR